MIKNLHTRYSKGKLELKLFLSLSLILFSASIQAQGTPSEYPGVCQIGTFECGSEGLLAACFSPLPPDAGSSPIGLPYSYDYALYKWYRNGALLTPEGLAFSYLFVDQEGEYECEITYYYSDTFSIYTTTRIRSSIEFIWYDPLATISFGDNNYYQSFCNGTDAELTVSFSNSSYTSSNTSITWEKYIENFVGGYWQEQTNNTSTTFPIDTSLNTNFVIRARAYSNSDGCWVSDYLYRDIEITSGWFVHDGPDVIAPTQVCSGMNYSIEINSPPLGYSYDTIEWQQLTDSGYVSLPDDGLSINVVGSNTNGYDIFRVRLIDAYTSYCFSNYTYINVYVNPPSTTYYKDEDGDGYGNYAITQESCTTNPPWGYVSNNTDCDDTNALINPSAIEIDGDGLDNNCNGTIDEDSTLSVENFDSNLNVKVFPNPTSSKVYIKSENDLAIEVFNSTGQKVLTSKSKTIDLSGYAIGIYFFKIIVTDSYNTSTYKVVKI